MGTAVQRKTRQELEGEQARDTILRAIRYLSERDGRPPTIREIGAWTGRSSTGNISYHMARLVREGTIENIGGSRCYKVVQKCVSH